MRIIDVKAAFRMVEKKGDVAVPRLVLVMRGSNGEQMLHGLAIRREGGPSRPKLL